MAMKLNQDAFEHAKKLIEQGKFEADDQDKWSEHQPSTDEENRFLEDHEMSEYGKWYLGLDPDEDEENKGRYTFPYGDFDKVHRGGVIAVKQRAAQNDYQDVLDAGNTLLDMIDGKSQDKRDS